MVGEVIPYDGNNTTGIDDTTRAVVLTDVYTSTSSIVDLTGCSITFWGLFCALILSTKGRVIFGKDFPLLKCSKQSRSTNECKTSFIEKTVNIYTN